MFYVGKLFKFKKSQRKGFFTENTCFLGRKIEDHGGEVSSLLTYSECPRPKGQFGHGLH
jgi:hypothetical protein